MLTASRHYGGSYVVVERTNRDLYIDARKDVRTPDHSHIEVVKQGHVRHRETVPNGNAPERIIALAKEHLCF